MSFYANQEILQAIEFERTRDANARRRFMEARRLARRNRRGRLSQWIGTSVMGTRQSEEQATSSATGRLATRSH